MECNILRIYIVAFDVSVSENYKIVVLTCLCGTITLNARNFHSEQLFIIRGFAIYICQYLFDEIIYRQKCECMNSDENKTYRIF